jgi:hypothetical protein
MQKLSGKWGGLKGPLPRSAGEAGWERPSRRSCDHSLFPAFSRRNVCALRPSRACLVKSDVFHRAGKRLKKGLCGWGTLRTSPVGTGERRLEEGHSTAVPLHGSAVPLLTDRACTHSKPLTHLTYAGIISPGLNLNIPQGGDEHVDPIPQ